MIYKELQKFKQPWIWILTILSGVITIGVFGFGLYKQIITDEKFGNKPLSDSGLIISFILILLFFILLFLLLKTSSLTTTIDKTGITYAFFPFHFKSRTLKWQEIAGIQVISYNPIRDYGGWGIRYGKKGMAYNISGDKGLFLSLKNGKTLLIGTQKAAELNDFLTQPELQTVIHV